MYLQHDTGFSVLLNRVGRTASNSAGYDGGGFNVTLDDAAANGDLHEYRSSPEFTTDSPLTGIWQPDGRNIDPDAVVETDDRDAMLAGFIGLAADGEWTLFVADIESGAAHSLDAWGMGITGVPEPQHYAIGAGAAMMAFSAWRRWRRRKS